MAQIELENGTDPEIRALAEAIIVAQEAEIALMQDWLAAHLSSGGKFAVISNAQIGKLPSICKSRQIRKNRVVRALKRLRIAISGARNHLPYCLLRQFIDTQRHRSQFER